MASELRVLFDRQDDGEGWKVRLVPGAAAGAPAALPLTVALSEKDYEDLRWYLEEYLDLPDYGSRVRAGRIENDLRRWGRELYGALFGDGDHRAMLDDLRRARPPRLLTLATDESEILRLPWELLADREGPLSRQGITIRRQLETPKTGRRRRLGLPLRLLVVVSRPADLGFIDPRATTPAMLDALDPLGGR